MSLFSRLFKSKKPDTIEQKLAALDLCTQEQLAQHALTSESEQVRLAAIKKLAFGDAMIKLATQADVSNNTQSAARKRIGELLDAGRLSVDQLGQRLPDQSMLLALCGYSSQAGIALLEQISNENLLLEIASNGSTTQLRQAAAARLEGRAALEQLAKHAMNKDKAVYKIVRSKLEVFKEEKQKEAQIAAEINAICGQAEQLAKRNVDDIFEARKKQIESSWHNFATKASSEARLRYEQAMEKCQNKLNEILEQEKIKEAMRAAEREAKKEVHKAVAGFRELIGKFYTHPTPNELNEELQARTQQSEEALVDAQNQGLDIKQEKQYLQELRAAANNLAQQLQQYGPLESLLEKLRDASDEQGPKIKATIEAILANVKTLKETPPPEIVARSRAAIDEWSEKIKSRADQAKQSIRDTAELIRKGNWAVSQGYVGRARAIYNELETKIENMDQLPSHIAQKFEDLKLAIQKLGDWHEFAVNPKKEELVNQMRALENSELHPKDLADKIHALQESWKELCRGGQNQDEALWQEFHAAAQKAYEPCKRHFDEQNQIREHNAQQRRTLIEQLTQYLHAYDWENAAWKDVEKTLKVSREAWTSYWPIPKKDTKDLQNAFDRLMDQLYEKLNQEYERNRGKKAAIVAQAKDLVEGADTASAIEAAKKLQAQWQSIGQCRRKDDQALWQEFRSYCDAVFAKRHQETEALKEERQNAKQHAENILQQLEEILAKNGDDFTAHKARAESLQGEFQSIGELPRESARALVGRLQELADAIQQKTQSERKAAVARAWQEVFAIADQVRFYENGLMQAGPDAISLEDVQNAIANTAFKWPYDTKDILEQRLKAAGSLSPLQQAEAESKLRLLCIRAEILNGQATPEADKDLRMQYQVESLKQNFGRAAETGEQAMVELFSEWLSVPAAPNGTYVALQERFLRNWLA
jgi:exonuclease SbcC